jgi:hypothetical protein
MDSFMSRETKISIGVLVVGFLAIGVYWFTTSKVENYSIERERIVLPHNKRDFFRALPEVKAYLQRLKTSQKEDQAFLPLESSELKSEAKEVQTFLLKNRTFIQV